MNDIDDFWDLLTSLKSGTNNKKLDVNEDILCNYCGSDNIVLEDGNYFCKSCNTLLDRYIDSHAEWRYFGGDDGKLDPNRCGLPVNDLLPESSLGSIISNRAGESYSMKIVRKYHMWNSMTYKERSLYNIFDSITTNAVNHGISPSIIEEAKRLYKQISESKISRGENRSGLIASSIYMSCKSHNVPRSTKEIAKIFNIKPTTMTRGCRKFQDIIHVNLNSSKPEDFIQRFASKLNIPFEIREVCKHVIEKTDKLNLLTENTPPSVASSIIYLCVVHCKLDITKKDLSIACGISEVTLTKCYKKLYDYRSILFPNNIILKYSIT